MINHKRLKEQYVCTELFRLGTKSRFSSDHDGELETLSRMTNTPTVDDDFSSSLTSFFPYYSKSNEDEHLGKVTQLLRKCGGRKL